MVFLTITTVPTQFVMLFIIVNFVRRWDEHNAKTGEYQTLISTMEKEREEWRITLANQAKELAGYQEQLDSINREKEKQRVIMEKIFSISREGTPVFSDEREEGYGHDI